MATTIQLGQDWIAFHYGVREYLDQFEEYPFVRKLCDTDPYGDTIYHREDCQALQLEIGALLKRAKQKDLPAPPELIVSETPGPRNPDDEPFGWDGSVEFLTRLNGLLEAAIKTDADLSVIGD